MATNVNKIQANRVGTRIAEELTYKVLPGTPVWKPLYVNKFKDTGGTLKLTAREPISESRQRLKGNITDMDAKAGIDTDLTLDLSSFFEGVFFARTRVKGRVPVTAVNLDTVNPDRFDCASTTGFFVNTLFYAEGFANASNNGIFLATVVTVNTSVKVADGTLSVAEPTPPTGAQITAVGFQATVGDIDVDTTGNFCTYTSTSLNFTTLGLIPGEWIYMGGDTAGTQFTNAVNNGFKRILSVAANALVVDKSASVMITEANTTSTIRMFWGNVLRNETGTLITDISYQVERTLGVPDTALPSQVQSEYITGCFLDEADITVPTADKMTVSLSYLGADVERRTGATGVKTGTRPTIADLEYFNTANDFARIKMSVISSSNEAPAALFAFITDFSTKIANNCTILKAVSVLGGFDVVPGTFNVSAAMKAYFTDVAGPLAVRANSDITLDMIAVHGNSGIALDYPLGALGGGNADVTKDAAVMVPLTFEAASGSKYNANMNHTVLMSIFPYLPAAAHP